MQTKDKKNNHSTHKKEPLQQKAGCAITLESPCFSGGYVKKENSLSRKIGCFPVEEAVRLRGKPATAYALPSVSYFAPRAAQRRDGFRPSHARLRIAHRDSFSSFFHPIPSNTTQILFLSIRKRYDKTNISVQMWYNI